MTDHNQLAREIREQRIHSTTKQLSQCLTSTRTSNTVPMRHNSRIIRVKSITETLNVIGIRILHKVMAVQSRLDHVCPLAGASNGTQTVNVFTT